MRIIARILKWIGLLLLLPLLAVRHSLAGESSRPGVGGEVGRYDSNPDDGGSGLGGRSPLTSSRLLPAAVAAAILPIPDNRG
ncbi:hypothetical protein [uncultured Thiocystis sp.]|jgi:hypothetical protein|uniref:hypothetical protein n=1 Tax=uncultured Thiocystis sp. TaxID=1202134 RepID=UPI0025FB1EAC|nr:hypothetical protein [uncultured Thiocystis sp.]